jgi:hypothetical protein
MGNLDSGPNGSLAKVAVLLAVSLGFHLQAAPRILAFGPAVRYVGLHRTYSLHVVAYGGQLAYQWWHQEPDSPQGHAIPVEEGIGSDRPRLVVPNAQATRDYNGWYWCVVSNKVTGETATSPQGQVFVIEPPTIIQNPQSQSVPARSRVSFTVEADPHGPVQQRYQWFFNDKPVPGAISKTFVLLSAGPRRQGLYSCRVKTIGGATLSAGAVLTVQ